MGISLALSIAVGTLARRLGRLGLRWAVVSLMIPPIIAGLILWRLEPYPDQGEHLSVNVLFDIPCSHSSSLMTSRLPDVCHG
jgi:hypothetical protein